MSTKIKRIFWIIVGCLIAFIISTATLIGIVCYKQQQNNYHTKYIDLLATIQYYDDYSVNDIYLLIGNLKDSKYYNNCEITKKSPQHGDPRSNLLILWSKNCCTFIIVYKIHHILLNIIKPFLLVFLIGHEFVQHVRNLKS